MNNKIKVLQINMSTSGHGGVSEILFKIYKYIDKTKVEFDFLSPNKTTYEIYRNEIEKNDGKLYGLNIPSIRYMRKITLSRRLNEFLKDKAYDIIHINSGSFFFNLQVAMIAKKNNIKRIIVHSHNTKNKKKIAKNVLRYICKPLLNYYATDFLACSKRAAEDMFTKKVAQEKAIIIKNGIELEKFKFNSEIRKKLREELNIEDKFVIGNVGRLVEQKRHDFVIDCFYEIKKRRPDTVLLIVGDGELEEKLKEKCLKLGIDKNVKFLGFRKDVNEIMQALDCFLFPSAYEGFGIAALEAQAAGLLTVVSEDVPKEVEVTKNIIYIDYKKGAHYWADKILGCKLIKNREELWSQVEKRGYNIKDTAIQVLDIYKNGKNDKVNESQEIFNI